MEYRGVRLHFMEEVVPIYYHAQQRILIADSSEINRSILSDMLKHEYEIIEAEDGVQAVAALQEREGEISLALLGIMMPRMDGFEVLTVMNQKHWIEEIPVIMISAENSLRQVERAYELGATEFVARPFNESVVRHRVVNAISLYASQKKAAGPASSERSLPPPAHEQMKYDFFAAMTEEIQFEYTLSPPVLTLSGWGAKKLGLDEMVADPKNNEKIAQILDPEAWRKISAALRRTTPDRPLVNHECTLHYDGQSRWYRITAQALWSADKPPRYIGAIGKAVDIHDARTKMKELENRAAHDLLTGLLNHVYAKERILEKLKARPGGRFALAICDLDLFKSANDNYGHIFGNRVLQHVAEKLRQTVRDGDIAARVGGDEFLIFWEYETEIRPVVERICAALTGTYEQFPLSVSVGVAQTDVVGFEYEKLFLAADQALYAAKRAGRSQCCFYDESMRDVLSVISPIDSGKDIKTWRGDKRTYR